ncbi:MAG TPA: hypothetical protein PLD88_13095 [Candidatus Berkiella sp.]|nr:hypothetical protein [Candidatus Berkiella sp.]
MVKRKELKQERKRYEVFIENVRKEIEGIKNAGLAPLEKKKTKLLAQRDNLVERAQKVKEKFTEAQ